MPQPADWAGGPHALILHLSDLHFSGYLQNVHGEGEWSRFAKPHDFIVLQEMESHITPLLRRWCERTIVVVTGDLTTAAEPPAYETVATYLRGGIWVNDRTRVGLGLVDEYRMETRLLVVPGNHDTWLRGSFWTRWRKYRDRRDLYRRYFSKTYERRVYPVVVGGISFLFFLLDSNEVAGFNPINFRNVVGRGRVGRDQLGQIQAEFNQFVNASPTRRPAGFDLDSAVRIGVLHHHPAIPDDVPQDLEQQLLLLEDADEVKSLFLNTLGTRLVLCGHQHFPYVYPAPSLLGPRPWLSCAGTATQRENRINSFKLYWLTQSNRGVTIVHEEYRRELNGPMPKFQPQPALSL